MVSALSCALCLESHSHNDKAKSVIIKLMI